MEISTAELADLLRATTPIPVTLEAFDTTDPGDPAIGETVIIRTVTMHLTGRVVGCSPSWFVLDEAAWIADSGRWADALANGTLNEVEPMGDGVRVARGAIVDITPWRHPLPITQK